MTDLVLHPLREAIIDGRIAQGEPLREISLARQFGTGRSAVREALRQLVQEGLVDFAPNRGAFVQVMSLADRLDVYVAREAIESGVARRVIDAPEPVDLSALELALHELREAVRGQELVTEEIILADVRFHQEMVRLADSPRLERSHDTLIAETRMLLRRQPRYPLDAYVRDHEQLYEALERRDPRAPELVAEHLRMSARLIRDELAREAREGRAREEEIIEEERTVP